MQDISSCEYSVRLEELGGFFRDQRWMHMHDVLRGQGMTFHELGHRGRRGALASIEAQGFTGEGAASRELGRRGGERGIEAALAILEDEGFTRKEALRDMGLRRCRGALASLEAQGFTGEGGAASASTDLASRGRRGALASLEVQGFTGEGGAASASTKLACRGSGGALASLEAQGFTGEGGGASASTEFVCRGRGGALASLEAQGFTGEGGAASASTELSRRGGEARSAIYRKYGNCIYPGCTYAILHGEFCVKHYQPINAEKSDKCRVCERVVGVNEKVTGGVCSPCYQKPEAIAARKKATAEKKATRGSCSTPGCKGVNFRGRGKCKNCLYPNKYKYGRGGDEGNAERPIRSKRDRERIVAYVV